VNETTQGIAHTNKDIIFKVLSQNYQDKSLSVYGIDDIPKIKRMLPNEYPVVATKFYGDSMFLLENDWLLCLEYESSSSWQNFLKYNRYVTNAIERLNEEGTIVSKVVIVVLYTGDMKTAPAVFDTGALCIQVKQVFLSKFNTDELYASLKAKLDAEEPLSDEDIMRFVILPLTQPDKQRKQSLIEDVVDLAKRVKNDEHQAFILAGILTAANKFIDKEYSKNVREWLKMTHVARLFEEEKLEAINEERKKDRIRLAQRMIADGMEMAKILKYTELTRAEIEQIPALQAV